MSAIADQLVRLLLKPRVGDTVASVLRPFAGFGWPKRVIDRLDYWNLRVGPPDPADNDGTVANSDAIANSSGGHDPAPPQANASGAARSPKHRPTILLFHSLPWTGGNWEFTKQLIGDLAAVAEQTAAFELRILLHPEQPEVDKLRERAPKAIIEVGRTVRVWRREANGVSRWFQSFEERARPIADAADLWLALSDRFAFPLLCDKPLAVIVHDVVQYHLPCALGAAFGVWQRRGMRPTVAAADRMICTSHATAADAIREYQVASQRAIVVPLSFEANQRFANAIASKPRELDSLSRDFLLCVGNASPHKGHLALAAAMTKLRMRLGSRTPALVCCGGDTQAFSRDWRCRDHAHWKTGRQAFERSGMSEGEDLWFLGSVDDGALRWLYEQCHSVVNPARFDNGTYCLIEANHFAKPFVSGDYPAAVELARRFGLVGIWYAHDSIDELCNALARAVLEPETVTNFGSPNVVESLEFSHLRFAERLLEATLPLARLANP